MLKSCKDHKGSGVLCFKSFTKARHTIHVSGSPVKSGMSRVQVGFVLEFVTEVSPGTCTLLGEARRAVHTVT